MRKKKWGWILVPVLLISLGGNIAVFLKARQYYLQLNTTRLDPLGMKAYQQQVEEQKGNGRSRVIFFGDSRAYSWPAPDMPTFEFINRAVSSQTSAQIAGRYDAHIQPLQPDILILQLGINDLKTIPLFPGQKESIIADCKANVQEIVTKATASGTTVILTTIFPLAELPIERRPFWSDDVAVAIEDVNAFLETLSSPNVILIDSAAVLADENGIINQAYSRDFLHINEHGYAALNQELVRILETQ